MSGFFLVTPLCDRSLRDVIYDAKQSFDVVGTACDIAAGMEYLHRHHIIVRVHGASVVLPRSDLLCYPALTPCSTALLSAVQHRDLKPDNVLLCNGTAIVADLGIARADFGTNTAKTVIGTTQYMAPELLSGGQSARYSFAVDVFSFGVVHSIDRFAPRPAAATIAQTQLMQEAGAVGDDQPGATTTAHSVFRTTSAGRHLAFGAEISDR